MFSTYILFSPILDRYYIGQTNDIRSRIQQHLSGSTAYTRQATDWQLVFLQNQPTRANAMRLERRIKQGKSQESIRRYISSPLNELSRPVPLADW